MMEARLLMGVIGHLEEEAAKEWRYRESISQCDDRENTIRSREREGGFRYAVKILIEKRNELLGLKP